MSPRVADAFKQAQRRYYDRSADTYDSWELTRPWARENRNQLLKIRKIAGLLQIQEGDLLLEVGVGTGIHAAWLQSHTVTQLIGLDLSVGMIRHAQRRLMHVGGQSAALVCGDGENLPFPSDVFDGVFCSGTLHHAADPLAMMRELIRTAKPGARVVVMEPNWLFPSNAIPSLMNPIERNILQMRQGRLTEWAVAGSLEELKVENFLYTPPFPRFLFPLFRWIDALASRLPAVRALSIMLVMSGRKGPDTG